MCDCPEIQEQWKPAIGDWVRVKKEVKWDGYNVCVLDGEITVILGIDTDYNEPVVGDVTDYALYSERGWVSVANTPKKNLIWLPRQDQLQEMVQAEGENNVEFRERIICDFSAWCQVLRMANDFRDYLSMEQLWLGFVMKQKFGKMWNGDKWE